MGLALDKGSFEGSNQACGRIINRIDPEVYKGQEELLKWVPLIGK